MDRKLGEMGGRGAVANSELLQDQLKNASSLSTQNRSFYYAESSGQRNVEQIEGIRFTANQAFFNQNNAWISTQFDANQTMLQVKPYTKAYFQLANVSPDIAQILALGENVSFVRNDIMVQIADTGVSELNESQLDKIQ